MDRIPDNPWFFSSPCFSEENPPPSACRAKNTTLVQSKIGAMPSSLIILDSVERGIIPKFLSGDKHVGSKLTRYQEGSLICDAWNKSATVGNANRGFKVTGIFSFKNKDLPYQLFFALADSEVPVPKNTTQEEENSTSEALINTPQINLHPAEPGTSSVKPPSPTKHIKSLLFRDLAR
ncbi:hypothetical protein AVEN_130887-1 [Araneus ventricosus]|uniref:Uncharacterized protein n=1 Tax=Araneus ventricosus TaxID=182803 RepID=A0A4Y2E3L8_ARAVE|nr:hypothetical protein AVEN_130887-1 [Araneus ventricosus]